MEVHSTSIVFTKGYRVGLASEDTFCVEDFVCFANGSLRSSEFCFLFFVEVEFYDALDTVFAEDYRNTDGDVVHAVLAFEVSSASDHLALVLDD